MPLPAQNKPAKEPPKGKKEAAHAERLRLAALLHDSLSQTLTAAQILAVLLVRKAAERDQGKPGESDEKILAGMIASAVSEMHAIVRQLRSPEPDAQE